MPRHQLLTGFHALQVRLRMDPSSVQKVWLDAARRDRRMHDLRVQLQEHQIPVHTSTKARLDKMVGARHQGVVASVDERSTVDLSTVCQQVRQANQSLLLLVLDGITDPHNLGACLRVADAAGVHAVVAPKDRAVGVNDVVARASAGASETVPFLLVTNVARTLRALQDDGVWVLGADERADFALHDVGLADHVRRDVAWVMGAEGAGMRRLVREACDVLVSIPMQGVVDSLNVSVASAVCLFETVRNRGG